MPNRPVSEIVKHRKLVVATENSTVSEASALMRDAKVGAVLVMENEHILGIFTERDCVYRVAANGLDPRSTPLGEVMTKHPYHIEAHRPFREALYMMLDHEIRHVPVLRAGTPIGIVTPKDALGKDLVEFEEDEHDREVIEQIL